MHDAAHLSGGSSRRLTSEPHHFTDSAPSKMASCMGHTNLHPSPAAASHRASSGRRRDYFRERQAQS